MKIENKFKKNNMEKNKWIKMSEQQPQIDGWDVQYYVGINIYGAFIVFSCIAEKDANGEVMESWRYETSGDEFDFIDIVWWMELPKTTSQLYLNI